MFMEKESTTVFSKCIYYLRRENNEDKDISYIFVRAT